VEIEGTFFTVSNSLPRRRPYTVPRFCHNCGKPYPWTRRGLDAVKSLADELDELELADREKLKRSFDELVADTPATGLAVMRVKKVLTKLKSHTASVIRDVLVQIATEAAKRSLFG